MIGTGAGAVDIDIDIDIAFSFSIHIGLSLAVDIAFSFALTSLRIWMVVVAAVLTVAIGRRALVQVPAVGPVLAIITKRADGTPPLAFAFASIFYFTSLALSHKLRLESNVFF